MVTLRDKSGSCYWNKERHSGNFSLIHSMVTLRDKSGSHYWNKERHSGYLESWPPKGGLTGLGIGGEGRWHGLQSMSQEEWIIFRSKTYKFEEFLSEWQERLKNSSETTLLTVRLLQDLDRYKVLKK
uniref:Uncharacterized protein n=1 Tax=Timema tahoe TaxID=61484 RepID=A0A7R9FK08_9NEOP|nr:unnamed protein product [Timema tahoe]